MMARYDRLHNLGARNLVTYNERVPEAERMPYIVIIIDELAELMMLARAEVEESIVRIAQLARATGIHLVVATQRPSVNVVTGLIKANIGTRVAFKVAQQVDSRVILDQVGAERLIGRGDMLYSAVEAGGKPERMQGAFVGEEQVHRLVEYLQNLPSTLRMQWSESIIQPVSADAEESAEQAVDDSELDELFWDCVQLVRSEGEGSTSRLQRTFGIGYNRAGRIMDQMFAMGIVGPSRGSKPREVLPGGPTGPSDRRGRRAGDEEPEPEPELDE
jgi:S-DNA-T family DNA segregation ATPase FtsK/SpoIIIE